MTIAIVGADGMIGYGLWSYFTRQTEHKVVALIRSKRDLDAFGPDWHGRVMVTGSLDEDAALDMLMANAEPDWVINCAGATMHADGGEDPLTALPANSLLPHRLHAAAVRHGARFLHLSTDCVFDGQRGDYRETDPVDAKSFYGLSKALGEVNDAPSAVTIRTSPIGFELCSRRGLLAWFLDQSGSIKGFTNAYFTGLTNLHLAETIDRHFLGRPDVHGLYHVTGPRISKYDLLKKLKRHFESAVAIEPHGELVLDRSLNGEKFAGDCGYQQPGWDEMLEKLAAFGSVYPETTVTRPVSKSAPETIGSASETR